MADPRARTGVGPPSIEDDTDDALGELDWDFPEHEPAQPATQPPSGTTPNTSARQTLRRDDAEMDAVIEDERAKTPPPPTSPPAGAVALARAMEGATMPPPPGDFDHPDSAVDVELGGEVEIDLDEEEPVDAKDVTRVAPSTGPGPTLGSLTARQSIPRVLLGPQEIAKLPIDHRAGFLLGAMDGMQTMEEILDVCPMPPNEAMELIQSLVDMGVIAIE